METRRLLNSLIKLKDEINQQIPLASNRFEEYETCPQDADQEEVDQQYLLHEEKFKNAVLECHIYEHINETFARYLKNSKLAFAEVNNEDKKKFKLFLLNTLSILISKMARNQKYLHDNDVVDIGSIEIKFCQNIDTCIDALFQGKTLSIDNKDFAQRFELDKILVNEREMSTKQMLQQEWFQDQAISQKNKQQMFKNIFLSRAIYFNRIKTPVGYCDEHAILAILRMFEKRLVDQSMTVEKIGMTYAEGDGHTFLVINRDKNSQLNDITSWGPKAILFDPWNKLVCLAEEFNSLPTYYFSYPDGAAWTVEATFTADDYELLWDLKNIENNLQITGNTNPVQLEAMMKEEYALKSLEEDNLKNTKYLIHDLLGLLKSSFPIFKDEDVNIYLTTSGDKPVQVISGFEKPVVALHKDLFLNGNFSLEELQFALARALYCIKHYRGISENTLSDGDDYFLDKTTLELMLNGEIAISYLRKCISFQTQHEARDSRSLTSHVRQARFSNIKGEEFPQRIKNISTLLAQDTLLAQCNKITNLPDKVSHEVGTLPKYDFFSKAFNLLQTKCEKIHYLTMQLPHLRIELEPFECNETPSARLKEFCHLLKMIHFDPNDREEATAFDHLIDTALELHIPGFDHIYRSILNVSLEKKIHPDVLPPLGIFKALQSAISEFVDAENKEAAYIAAKKIQFHKDKLKNHFEHNLISQSAKAYIHGYQKAHANELPQGMDRYFGSTVGHCIQWKSFTSSPSNTVPWERQRQWAREDNSKLLAKTLWQLGVVRDECLWPIFDFNELIQLTDNNNKATYLPPLLEFEGVLAPFGDNSHLLTTFADIVQFTSNNHEINVDRFCRPDDTSEEAYQHFFDKNLPALIAPTENFNVDNETVHALLTQFLHIIVHGTAQEKQIVKSFFLGRDDKRDLKYLQKIALASTPLPYGTPYVNFFIEQQYANIPFQLFSTEEILKIIKRINFIQAHIPAHQYIRIFLLNFPSLTLPCLEQVVPLMYNNDMNHSIAYVIKEHLNGQHYTLISHEAAVIARLLSSTMSNPFFSIQRKQILTSFTWKLPNSLALISIDYQDIIDLYRAYDSNLLFSDRKSQIQFGKLVLDKINSLKDSEKQSALEMLLFTSEKKEYKALTDIQLRNDVVDSWIQLIVAQYGKDTNDAAYYEKIETIVNKIAKEAPSRDVVPIFNKLANAIEAQQKTSDLMGMLVEPEKYEMTENKLQDAGISELSQLCMYLGQDKQDQIQLLNFFSAPLTDKTAADLAAYLINHNKTDKIFKIFGYETTSHTLADQCCTENICQLIYQMFWDLSLEQRAVIINYLLIPPDKMINDTTVNAAYQEAFIYVAGLLFPEANNASSDDHFAKNLLQSYLEVADPYKKSYLLSGMLVASNENQQAGKKSSIGKKLALLCEHMGPAYVKLAQAIHSHPNTPDDIRHDLNHVKSHANPPSRWQLWRMLVEVLPKEDIHQIKRMGKLLGSASYNLALEIEMQDGSHIVLLLLRENAAKDAKLGFNHLKLTMNHCQHPRIDAMQEAAIAMINEAESLSEIEMNHELMIFDTVVAMRRMRFAGRTGRATAGDHE